MSRDWTPISNRSLGPMYLDEFNDDVIGNLLNRQEGDTDGEVKTVAKHVATDYAFSADPDDPLITRYSIWHKPLQANAANEPGEGFEAFARRASAWRMSS